MVLFNKLHAAGHTIILVTHEEYIAENAKRIVRLHDGLISSDELFDKNRQKFENV